MPPFPILARNTIASTSAKSVRRRQFRPMWKSPDSAPPIGSFLSRGKPFKKAVPDRMASPLRRSGASETVHFLGLPRRRLLQNPRHSPIDLASTPLGLGDADIFSGCALRLTVSHPAHFERS